MLRKQTEYVKGSREKDSFAPVWFSVSALHLFVVVVVVVVALSWVKAEPLYPHHNYILG